MKKRTVLSMFVFTFCFSSTAISVKPDRFKNAACPEGWSANDVALPVLSSTANPWSKDAAEADKSAAKNRIALDQIVDTIDKVPVTNEALVDDLLTVASNCLAWRNKVVDGERYYPPAGNIEYLPENGHVASSVF